MPHLKETGSGYVYFSKKQHIANKGKSVVQSRLMLRIWHL